MLKILFLSLIFFTLFLTLILLLVSKKPPPITPRIDFSNVATDAQKAADKCQSFEKSKMQCYRDTFKEIVSRNSFVYAVETLGVLMRIDPRVKVCHTIAHTIAITELSKNPSSWRTLLEDLDETSCSYGYIHGLLEGRSRYDSGFTLNEKTITEICDIIGGTKIKRNSDQACAHIMGHILLAEKEGNVSFAIEVCTKTSLRLQYQCYGGSFMENFTQENLLAHEVRSQRVSWSQETVGAQEKLCRLYDGLPAMACWMEISHLYNHFFSGNPQGVRESCQKAGKTEFSDSCYLHGLIELVAKETVDDFYLASLCQPFFDEEGMLNRCVDTVTGGLLNASTQFADRAITYCSLIPKSFQMHCFEKVDNLLQGKLTEEEKQNVCNKIPEDYRSFCTPL